MRRSRKSTAFEKALGYKFKDRDLLQRALTHASARGDGYRVDNERLEFLGDRVLGLAVSEALWRADPLRREGDMARHFNRLVRRETCADVARTIKLGDDLILSESEAASGGRSKDTILADAMEAVLGAIFVEAGYDRVRKTILSLWEDGLDAVDETAPPDPKSALQEWAQGRGHSLPRYAEVSREGPDHAPSFVAEVAIDGLEPARGAGASKRQAEQVAARTMLERLGVLKEPSHDDRQST
ncbi:MAG: ribonuclease III [Pseudomonadota bacterium]